MPAHPKPTTSTNAVTLHIHRWWVVVFIAIVVGLGIATLRYMAWLS